MQVAETDSDEHEDTMLAQEGPQQYGCLHGTFNCYELPSFRAAGSPHARPARAPRCLRAGEAAPHVFHFLSGNKPWLHNLTASHVGWPFRLWAAHARGYR